MARPFVGELIERHTQVIHLACLDSLHRPQYVLWRQDGIERPTFVVVAPHPAEPFALGPAFQLLARQRERAQQKQGRATA